MVLTGCGGGPPLDTAAPSPRPGTQSAAPVTTPEPTVPRSLATLAPARSVDAPVALEVSSVRISADVVPVGVAEDGQMELPPDPDMVGWYQYGPTVGDGTGSIVLAGHVDSRTYGVGQLVRLQETEVGDDVIVRTVSGQDIRYKVVEVRSIPTSELPLDEVFSREGDERLLLITCDGEYDRQQGGYLNNVVVTAVPA